MPMTLSKTAKGGFEIAELADLRTDLLQEKKRLEGLLERVDEVLRHAGPTKRGLQTDKEHPAPRSSPLDHWRNVVDATKDLRVANGNISAERVARLFGISLSQLAAWLGRTKQAVNKTPDADSLQNALGYLERVARLRLVTGSDAEFRKWLRMPHPDIDGKNPLELMANGHCQALADLVDDILTGTPG